VNQSSGSEDDDTDEHLRIHVDNSDKASSSAGFSFWFGIKVGNDSASSDSEVVDSPVNTTRSDSDEEHPVSFTAEPSTAPGDGGESNTESQGSEPGRQSASDMIQDNPTGIQLSLNTSNSSNVSKDFSFSEKTRSSHGYNLIADSDRKQTSSDVHFVVALGTERTDLEFGKSKSSGTDVSMVRDQYSHNVVPGNLYHTAQFTDTYSEHTRSNEAFQYSMNADTPVTNTVFLKERFDGSSRDYRSGELGTAIVLKTERYFNTTDRDDGPTDSSNSLDNTASDETPIYLYVESFTGAGGTIEYNRIEETPPYPIATIDASDNPVTPSDAIVNTQPFEQQRPVEDILAEYRDRATKIARWQAELAETTDPGMRNYLQGLINTEQSILADIAATAIASGATQEQLGELETALDNAASEARDIAPPNVDFGGRDLDTLWTAGLGTHGFLTFFWEGRNTPTQDQIDEYLHQLNVPQKVYLVNLGDGKIGFTIGGHQVNGKLVPVVNQAIDLQSYRQWNAPSTYPPGLLTDFSYGPAASYGSQHSGALLKAIGNFMRASTTNPVKYSALLNGGYNCNDFAHSWISSVLGQSVGNIPGFDPGCAVEELIGIFNSP
jgi:hypothetical protein